MAAGRLNFMPPYVDPASDWDTRMRGVAGGDPNFFKYGRFGLLTDNSVLRERIEGSSTTGASSGGSGGYRNSGMAPSFGGGNTSDDPGGYNWDTFSSNLGRATEIGRGLVEYRMDNKRMASARAQAQAADQFATAARTYQNTFTPGMSYNNAYMSAANSYFSPQPPAPPTGGAPTAGNKKTSRNPGVKKPKSTAPKINAPKAP
jgi:hypothetical protein